MLLSTISTTVQCFEVGKNFCNQFQNHIEIPRGDKKPKTNNILYFLSTSHNYNIYEDLTLDVETNIYLLCQILENCKQKGLIFNYISTMHVYGTQKKLPITEDSNCKPEGMYPITKKCAEDIVITFCKTFGINYRIIRLCNVLGVYKNYSPKKNAITWMINQVKEDKDIKLLNGGNIFRDVMHINDVCSAIKLICTKGKKNEIYNVGSGEPITLEKIIRNAKEILNSRSKIIINNEIEFNSETNAKNFWLDTNKLNNLGFIKKFSLEETIKDITK